MENCTDFFGLVSLLRLLIYFFCNLNFKILLLLNTFWSSTCRFFKKSKLKTIFYEYVFVLVKLCLFKDFCFFLGELQPMFGSWESTGKTDFYKQPFFLAGVWSKNKAKINLQWDITAFITVNCFFSLNNFYAFMENTY